MFKKTLLFIFTITISSVADAAIIETGFLSYNTDTQEITDTSNSTIYSSLDSTVGYTYDDLLIEMNTGIWQGWRFANSSDTDSFINSALGQNASMCLGPVERGKDLCGIIMNWDDGDLGRNYNGLADFWLFISSFETPGVVATDFGMGQIFDNRRVLKRDDIYTLAESNLLTTDTNGLSFGFLLVKENTFHVDSPHTAIILLLGLYAIYRKSIKNN